MKNAHFALIAIAFRRVDSAGAGDYASTSPPVRDSLGWRPPAPMRPASATAISKSRDFGERVRQARDRARLSQRQLASNVGVDKRAVQGWEAGESGITWPNLKRLAKQLDVSADWLRLGDELSDVPAAPDPRSFTPEQVIEAAAQAAAGAIEKALGPVNGSSAPLTEVLHEITTSLARIEAALTDDDAGEAPRDPAGDDVVAATRAVKNAVGEDLDEADAPANHAVERTPHAGDASPGSARARRSGTQRTAAKRAR
jgi:transcriptional regulator with XRE-family HTH domain